MNTVQKNNNITKSQLQDFIEKNIRKLDGECYSSVQQA